VLRSPRAYDDDAAVSDEQPSDTGPAGTRRVAPLSPVRALHALWLEVIAGPDVGRHVIAEVDEISIGTERANDLVLTDSSVSRHHVAIAVGRRGARIRDLGSTNGTRIDGVEIAEAMLRPGQRIELGHTTFAVKAHGVVQQPLASDDHFADLLGESSAMRRVFALLPKLAAADTTLLLTGETGCGKSLLARALHRASARREGPFVIIDCGAIAPGLIESELFGHVKGAFTGATSDRPGALRAARGGTVLLEEVGELPLDLQPRLLRALEEREVTPVGSNQPVALDVRIIAATHRDLRTRVNTGDFRADLYYRLCVLTLRIPALRERRADIPLLVDSFHRELTGSPAPPDLIATFAARDWPGNVRELRAAVERAHVMGEPDAPPEAPPADDAEETVEFRVAKERIVARWEVEYLTQLMARHRGNLSQAAREARLDRNYLRELLTKRGLTPQRS